MTQNIVHGLPADLAPVVHHARGALHNETGLFNAVVGANFPVLHLCMTGLGRFDDQGHGVVIRRVDADDEAAAIRQFLDRRLDQGLEHGLAFLGEHPAGEAFHAVAREGGQIFPPGFKQNGSLLLNGLEHRGCGVVQGFTVRLKLHERLFATDPVAFFPPGFALSFGLGQERFRILPDFLRLLLLRLAFGLELFGPLPGRAANGFGLGASLIEHGLHAQGGLHPYPFHVLGFGTAVPQFPLPIRGHLVDG